MFSGTPNASNAEDTKASVDAQNTDTSQSQLQIPFVSNLLRTPTSSGPPSPTKSAASIMFAEPDTRYNSSEVSREGSIASSQAKKRAKKSSRPKMCYSICHPPPSSHARQKLHRRPRSLLQLHKLSPNARPVPAFEVVPSANFSVRLTRSITKVFKTKHGLCPNDLVILRAENYHKEDEDEEEQARHVVGLICKGRKEDAATAGKAKICMANGSEWEAYTLMNGGYEFFSTDEHGLGLTVRWVPKKVKEGKKEEKKFNFSTISPNSRRHPVIASLAQSGIDINDTYTIPTPAALTPLSSPKIKAADDAEAEEEAKEQVETDEQLRTIITATGIWVTFKEGWSPTFKYDDSNTPGVCRSPSTQNSPTKSTIATPPGSPLSEGLQKRNSIRSVSASIKRTSSLLRGNRVSTASTASTTSLPTSEPVAVTRSASINKGRSRADSTSTVLVHRAASNRRRNNQAAWRPDLLEAKHQLQETSREDLRSTPPPQTAAAFDKSPSSRYERRKSIMAEPLIPDSADGTPGLAPSALDRPMSPEKRESTATTTTDASDAPRKPRMAASKKKKSGWRSLLCGMAE